MSDIIIYEDGSLALNATVQDETVWLNQKQMAELFDKSEKTVNEHIKNVYKEGELTEKPTIRKFRTVQKEGGREVERDIEYYSLDVIISVGYRVKSRRGTQFRIWANSILKEYIIKGYALNKEKLQQQKLQELEQTIALIKQGLDNQELSMQEAKGFVEIIGNYAKSWWGSFALKCNGAAVLTAERLSDSIVFATKVAPPSIFGVAILVTDKLQRDKKELVEAWV